MKIHLILFICCLHQIATAQVIPGERRTDWSLAGYQDSVPVFSHELDITSFGAVGDGSAINDTCIQNALSAMNGMSGTIYFPTGNYLFRSSITLPDSIVLKGPSADSTTLSFNLNGNGNLIRIQGSISAASAPVIKDAYKDSTFIILGDSSFVAAGDYIKIYQNDSTLVFSTWAYKSVGQLVQVKSTEGFRVNLQSPLRKSFLVADSVRVRKITPRNNVGIECLKIKRIDASAGQTNNIDLNYAARCWIKGVESDSANFAHIAISNSLNIEISGCYLHNAFAYGGGGQAYGVVVQYTSSECLIENNIFDRLRHSMLLQAGANGNVFGYNSSTNPFWVSGALPATSAGDMVLHGNYVFMNLFEGNSGQNIVIDDSHGINGPYNTFFRNRADLYGIFMNNNPPSNNQNIVGNEITNTGFLMGLYQLSGTGHFTYGNNVKGTVNPAGTNFLSDTSYYKHIIPGFWNSAPYPAIGYPNMLIAATIPARERWLAGESLTDCRLRYPSIIINSSTPPVNSVRLKIFPNPSNGFIHVSTGQSAPMQLYITDVSGHIVAMPFVSTTSNLDLSFLSPGLYFVSMRQSGTSLTTEKLVISR